jgi:hypothetical protein
LVEQEAWKDLGEVKADVESAGRRQAMLKATRLKLEAHKAAREKTTAGINAKLGAIGMPVVEPKPFVPNPKVKRTAALPAPKPVSAWVRKAPAHSGAVPTPGKSGELLKFVACFEPLAGKTEAAAALRTAGFRSADPNGNGLCSLAEIEGFVLKTLLAAHPKTGKGDDTKEPGRDIFDAFRPCYIRAFNDAKVSPLMGELDILRQCSSFIRQHALTRALGLARRITRRTAAQCSRALRTPRPTISCPRASFASCAPTFASTQPWYAFLPCPASSRCCCPHLLTVMLSRVVFPV